MNPAERLEKVKELSAERGRHLTSIEYQELKLLPDDACQCSCQMIGHCPFSDMDEICDDRNCYADQLRDRIMLHHEQFNPAAPSAPLLDKQN